MIRFRLVSTFATVLLFSVLVNRGTVAAEEATQPTLQSYSLQEAIDFALTNNPNLQIARERIGQAAAQLGEAQAGFYPQVQIRMNYEHTDNPSRAFGMIISQRRLNFSGTDFNHPGGTDNYRPEVTATYPLFRGGQDYYNSKAAELGVQAAELNESAVRNQLIETVTSGYYTLLAAKEANKVARQSVKAVTSELRQSRTRYEAGALLKSDLLSLEVQLAQSRDAEIQTANAVELSRSSLKTVLGLGSAQSFSARDEDRALRVPDSATGYSDLLAQALAQRPEIIAARTRVEMAEKKLRAAQGAQLPRANAYLSYGSDSPNIDFSGNRDNITAGVTVEMDMFTGFATRERINMARHQLTEAQTVQRQSRLAIENEVQSAYLRLKDALARVNVTQTSIAAAEEALRLVKAQRKAGVVTVTRYIEAEVARDKSLSRDITARFDALRAEAELNKALGVWK